MNNYTMMRHASSRMMFKVAVVTSQSLAINGQERIYFDEEPIKNLKREFKLLNDLEKFLVLAQLKIDSTFRLRVPLTSLL
jgi:hypothetical protein